MSVSGGINEKLEYAGAVDLHVASTVMFWAKPEVNFGVSTHVPLIISGVGPTYRTLSYYPDATAMNLEYNGADYDSSTTDLVAGTWYHFAFRRTSSTYLRLLVNGVEEGSTITTDSSGDSANNLTTLLNATDLSKTWNSSICQVRIWSTNLSDEEVVAEKNSATLVKTANIWASWRLLTYTNDAAGYQDSSGNNRHLTPTGDPATDADNPTQGGAGGLMWLA